MATIISGAPTRFLRALAAVSLVLGFATPARADFINIQSDSAFSQSGIGEFTGTIDYTVQLGDSKGTLLITLENTSLDAGGGYITGFVFNFESTDPDAKVTLVDGPESFENAPNQHAGPFGGPFEAGAGVNGHFMGGGGFVGGIPVGESRAFEFEVEAEDSSSLTAADFMSGPLEHNFIVRFRGFQGNGSDLVPAQSAVPGPSALVMLALFTAVAPRRKRLIARLSH